MSTAHESETLNTLLATVIAKARPDNMTKAAESAAAAFKAGLAIFAGATKEDMAPALLDLVRAQTAALKAAGEQVSIPVVRHFGGAQVVDHSAGMVSNPAASADDDDVQVDVPVTQKF